MFIGIEKGWERGGADPSGKLCPLLPMVPGAELLPSYPGLALQLHNCVFLDKLPIVHL